MRIDIDTVQNPQQLADQLPGFFRGDLHVSTAYTPSLSAARQQLADFHPKGYASTRNHVEGNVSRLNPYITWGVLTLAEVQDDMKAKTNGGQGKDYQKFVNELAWKQYFREGYMALGGRVYESLEPYKYPTKGKKNALPDDIENATTGLECIDSIVRTLKQTGYLHNHKRMWFASYLVHFAGVEWWHGEELFYRYLLDGEPGPNALSWQWVASTFSNKPYVFNNDNMKKNGHDPCSRDVPFAASYTDIDRDYFGGYSRGGYDKRPQEQPYSTGEWPYPGLVRPVGEQPLVVLHAERLSERAAVLEAAPSDAPVVVYLDAERFEAEQPSFMRLHFAVNLAADLVRTLREQGRDAELLFPKTPDALVVYARDKGCRSLATPDSWHPDTWEVLRELDEQLPVSVVEDAVFAKTAASLRSFSSFWKKAEKEVMRR
ncbi:MAG: FAD-binding domain-containing protein [Trueperaceae bacterium]|nr:FAD-binding domain-containing protein [Trueperaceae bacterium]